MNKKEIKDAGEALAERFEQGGSDEILEHYNGFSDILSDEAIAALNQNTDLGELIEFQMNTALAKRFAKLVDGKFIPNGGIK